MGQQGSIDTIQWQPSDKQLIASLCSNSQGLYEMTQQKNRTLIVKTTKGNDISNKLNEIIGHCVQLQPIILVLVLKATKLKDIQPLSELNQISNLISLEIRLSCNQISDLSPLAELKSLQYLTSLEIRLKKNQISDIQPLSELKSLQKLTHLGIYLGGNQLPSYTRDVIKSIKYLDQVQKI